MFSRKFILIFFWIYLVLALVVIIAGFVLGNQKVVLFGSLNIIVPVVILVTDRLVNGKYDKDEMGRPMK